jgi:hypothetical protein
VIEECGLQKAEVDKYRNKLEGLEYVKRGRKSAGLDYTLINVTKEGLKNSNKPEERSQL